VIVLSSGKLPSGGYYGEIMCGITGAADDCGWTVRFGGLRQPSNRRRIMDELFVHDHDGAILFSSGKHSEVEQILEKWDGPFVVVDHYFDNLPVSGVIDDSERGVSEVVKHFLGLGHRRIAYLEPPDRSMNPWRYDGYQRGFAEAGLDVDEDLVIHTPQNHAERVRISRQLLMRPDRPTAVFADDDDRAMAVWTAAEECGLEVGRDLALAGYGDTAADFGHLRMLTSVHFDRYQIGYQAGQHMNELLHGTMKNGELIVVPAKLVIRGSSQNDRAEDVRPGRATEEPSGMRAGATS
jgi:LacI family transcriptional regulator